MQVVDLDADEAFRLKFGTPATAGECLAAMRGTLFAEASGALEMDECRRILGRPIAGQRHRFNHTDTEEIVLNWSR